MGRAATRIGTELVDGLQAQSRPGVADGERVARALRVLGFDAGNVGDHLDRVADELHAERLIQGRLERVADGLRLHVVARKDGVATPEWTLTSSDFAPDAADATAGPLLAQVRARLGATSDVDPAVTAAAAAWRELAALEAEARSLDARSRARALLDGPAQATPSAWQRLRGYASLLVGDADGAVSLLAPLVQSRPSDHPARLVLAQERERSLISRELHDVLGQTLTGMMIHLHAARRAASPESAGAFTDTAMQLAQEAVNQVRTLSFSLRPAQLDLLGLVSAVRTAAQRIAEPAGLALHVSARGTEPKRLHETASVFVRLVQEALTNVVRHANASSVWVRLRFMPQGRIGLLVVDNGRGFEKHEVLDGQPSERNVGLYGMIERTELAGGRIHIRTTPGRGVAIRAVL